MNGWAMTDSTEHPSIGGITARLFGWAMLGLAPALVAGLWPTWRLSSGAGLTAMAIGAGISLLGSLVGSILAARWMMRRPALAGFFAMAAASVRFVIVLALGVTVALSTSVHTSSLLVWVAIGYLAALAGETAGLVRLMRQIEHSSREARSPT